MTINHSEIICYELYHVAFESCDLCFAARDLDISQTSNRRSINYLTPIFHFVISIRTISIQYTTIVAIIDTILIELRTEGIHWREDNPSHHHGSSKKL
jgi:hypothetical protein